MEQNYLSIEVEDRETFLKFLDLLLAEFQQNGKNWENNTLQKFLGAMREYSEDIDGFYKNLHLNIDLETANWRIFADILRGAIVYE